MLQMDTAVVSNPALWVPRDRRENDAPRRLTPAEWLVALAEYQDQDGKCRAVPSKSDPYHGPLSQWVQRMRRYAVGGRLDVEVAIVLASLGIDLRMDGNRYMSALHREEQTFAENLERLQAWIAQNQKPDGVPDMTWVVSRRTPEGTRCFSFLDHVQLKARQGLLPDHHRERLEALPLRVCGQRLRDRLDAPTCSARRNEAVMPLDDAEREWVYGRLPAACMQRSVVYDATQLPRCRPGSAVIYLPGRGLEELAELNMAGEGVEVRMKSYGSCGETVHRRVVLERVRNSDVAAWIARQRYWLTGTIVGVIQVRRQRITIDLRHKGRKAV
jgi:hypothetical protein